MRELEIEVLVVSVVRVAELLCEMAVELVVELVELSEAVSVSVSDQLLLPDSVVSVILLVNPVSFGGRYDVVLLYGMLLVCSYLLVDPLGEEGVE